MVTWATTTNQTTTSTSSVKNTSATGYTNNRSITSNNASSGEVSFEADGFFDGDSSAYPAVFGLDDGTTTNGQVDYGFGGIGSADEITIIEGSTSVTTTTASIADIFKVVLNYSTGEAKYYKNGTLLTTTTGHTFPSTVYGFTTAYYNGDGIKDVVMVTAAPSGSGSPGLPPPPIVVRF